MTKRTIPDAVRRNNLHQQLLITAWGLGLAVIVFLWISAALGSLTSGGAGTIGALARLFGLLATYSALTQMLLMGRVWWIERPFGLDTLARFHRINGYVAIGGIVIHSSLMILSHSLRSGEGFFSQYLTTITSYPNVIQAALAQILFIAVIISSIYIVRRRLRFEAWYFVHLLVYVAIILASLHQFRIGSTLLSTDLATIFWYSLYGFVALNLLVWRFIRPIYQTMSQGFTVARVVRETPTVTSIYIKGKHISMLGVRPGQFILVRFLTKKLWWQEHPFTVSMIPHDNLLRISVRDVGDYTHDIQSLSEGARVMVSGPFGRFTSEKALTNKRLFIAGGIGITPIRSMFEEAIEDGIDSILLYGNRAPDDVPLKNEIETLRQKGVCKVVYVYSEKDGEKTKSAETGHINGVLIKKHVPDFMERDIYLCGPVPMMEAIEAELKASNFPLEQLHCEKFSLHP